MLCTDNEPFMLISDMHFHKPSLSRGQSSIEWLIEQAVLIQPRNIFILGDSLHCKKDDVNIDVLRAFRSFLLKSLAVSSVPNLHILLGNHDLLLRHDRSKTSLDSFDMIDPRIKIYRENTLVELQGQKFVMIPYHDNEQELFDYVNDFRETYGLEVMEQTIALMHVALVGAKVNGFTEQTGHEFRLGMIKMPLLLDFKRVFTGHFHAHASYFNGKIMYVGSPMQQNFADVNDLNRGYVLFDGKSNEAQLIPNPHAEHYIREFFKTLLLLPEKPPAGSNYLENKYLQFIIGKTYLRKHGDEVESVKRKLRLYWRTANNPAAVVVADSLLLRPDEALEQTNLSIAAADLRNTNTSTEEEEREAKMLEAASLLPHDIDMPLPDVPGTATALADIVHDLSDPAYSGGNSVRRMKVMVKSYLQELAAQDDTKKHNVLELTAARQRDLHKLFMEKLLRAFDALEIAYDGSSARSRESFYADFSEVVMTNFLGICGTIRFKVDQLPNGLWIVQGRNGQGKSTLCDAIAWVLFGHTCRAQLKVLDVVNDSIASSDRQKCEVSVLFRSGLKIIRTRNVVDNKLRPMELMICYPDGTTVERSSMKEAQSEIDRTLQIDFKTFLRRVFLTSDDTANFIRSSDKEKREIAEALLGFEQFEYMAGDFRAEKQMKQLACTEVKTHLEALEKELQQTAAQRLVITTEVEGLRMDISQKHHARLAALTGELSKVALCCDRFEQVQAENAAKLLHWQSECDTLNELLRQCVENLHVETNNAFHRLTHANATEREQLRLSAEQAANKLQTVRTQKSRLVELVREISDYKVAQVHLKDSQREYEFRYQTLGVIEDSIKTQEFVLHSLKEDVYMKPISECLEKESIAVLKEYVKRASSNQKTARIVTKDELKVLDSFQQQLAAQVSSHSREFREVPPLPELESEERTLLKQTSEIGAKLKILERFDAASKVAEDSKVASLQQQLEDLDRSVKSASRQRDQARAAATQPLDQFQVDRTRLMSQIEECHMWIARREDEIRCLEAKLPALEEADGLTGEAARIKREALDAAKVEEENMTFWAESLASATTKQRDKFRCYCLSQEIDRINELLAHNIQLLNADPNGVQQDNLNCQLTDNLELFEIDNGIGMHKRSPGQRKRTELAVFFTFFTLAQQRSPFHSSIMFLDEVMDSLDENGQIAVQKWCHYMLAQRCSSLKQIFCITHSNNISNSATGFIHVEREQATKITHYEIESRPDLSGKVFVRPVEREEKTCLVVPAEHPVVYKEYKRYQMLGSPRAAAKNKKAKKGFITKTK